VNLYLGHLAWRVFEHSMIFPFVLTLLGLGIIAATVYYQRRRAAIELRIESWIPLWVRDLLPPARMAAR
jgi:ABC-type iron transport system FetAB permease component